MKAKCQWWNGSWWCRRMGVTGQGDTPMAAFRDMQELYAEAIRKSAVVWEQGPRSLVLRRVRQG